jgi:hypothetical protein
MFYKKFKNHCIKKINFNPKKNFATVEFETEKHAK